MPLYGALPEILEFAPTRVTFVTRFTKVVALTESLTVLAAVIISSADVIDLIGWVETTRPLADATGIFESLYPQLLPVLRQLFSSARSIPRHIGPSEGGEREAKLPERRLRS